jgi:polyhydroxybutyrate depolymerase
VRYFQFLLFFVPLLAFSQQTINDSIISNGVYRHFITYIPAINQPSESVPLLFNLHGRTATSNGAMWNADFRDIADTANFIIVHPQGLIDSSGVTHWNYGQSNVDDISFFNDLYAHLTVSLYNIDVDRVYVAGMSNGGSMSYSLACNLSDKIAAISCVTGSMTSYQYQSCNPSHPTPILHIHGTVDALVPFSLSLSSIAFWRNYNNCNISADIFQIPDFDLSDSSTVEHIVYNNGDNGVTTELFKIINGGHSWPGSNFSNGTTNYDINASVEIWKFFSRYSILGLIATNVSIDNNDLELKNLVKQLDILGREKIGIINQPLFYLYDDGTVEKRIIIE